MAAPKDAVVEQEPAAAPQTAQDIARTEEALGIAPQKVGAAPPRAQVRMGVSPTTIDEAWRMASFMAQSELVPKAYQKRPSDILVAIQYGMELGFPPMQALQSIAVINGRPAVWGDGFKAVIMASPLYKDDDEFFEVDGERRSSVTIDDLKKDSTTAVCLFWRHGKATPTRRDFSVAKAKTANLWGKSGPWSNYPDVMLAARARSFAGRAAFPDLLRGIRTAEEAMDAPPDIDVQPEAPREVRRISETKAGPVEQATNDGSIGTGPDRNDVVLGPVGVKAVQQFLGGYCAVLDSGDQVEIVGQDLDAAELDKFVGTPNKVRLTCEKRTDGTLALKSFAISD